MKEKDIERRKEGGIKKGMEERDGWERDTKVTGVRSRPNLINIVWSSSRCTIYSFKEDNMTEEMMAILMVELREEYSPA